MSIHPTAIIHPSAHMGNAVEIGPYACLDGAAVVGDGTVIQAHAVLTGAVEIGRGNLVGYGAVIGAAPQDLSFDPGIASTVRIGDHNQIREHCTIHRGTTEGSATVIGDNCFLMAGVHLAHNVRLGNGIIIANNALLAGYVEVEDRVFIGGGCVFHQFMRIGRLALTRGISGFGKDIPPFCVGARVNEIVGLNVIGMRRAGLNTEQRQEIKRAFDLLYRSGLNTRQTLERAAETTWQAEGREFFDFVASAKKRGLCALGDAAETGD